MELKEARPCCGCYEEERSIHLVIILDGDKEHHFREIREYEISTFVDYFKRTHAVKEVRILF